MLYIDRLLLQKIIHNDAARVEHLQIFVFRKTY